MTPALSALLSQPKPLWFFPSRCLAALAEWEQLLAACRHAWAYVEPHIKREVAPMGAAAAWQMGQWGEMEVYVSALHHGDGGTVSSNATFLSAVMAVHGGRYEHAQGVFGLQHAACWRAFCDGHLQSWSSVYPCMFLSG